MLLQEASNGKGIEFSVTSEFQLGFNTSQEVTSPNSPLSSQKIGLDSISFPGPFCFYVQRDRMPALAGNGMLQVRVNPIISGAGDELQPLSKYCQLE